MDNMPSWPYMVKKREPYEFSLQSLSSMTPSMIFMKVWTIWEELQKNTNPFNQELISNAVINFLCWVHATHLPLLVLNLSLMYSEMESILWGMGGGRERDPRCFTAVSVSNGSSYTRIHKHHSTHTTLLQTGNSFTMSCMSRIPISTLKL